MGLNKVDIKTFNDLCEAFFQRYNYNLHSAPDKSELQAMTQDDNESFKAYAQRWRDFAAQIQPPLEEKELTKIFLKTLDQFYYDNMVARAPNNFAEMMTMGMCLEEGVREGRLIKGSVLAGNSKKKDHEVSMVKGQPRQQAPQQFSPQKHAPRTKFDPIPIKYSELLPTLLERNWVQIKAPPPIPKKLPARFRADLSCVFHQGAPGHDVEGCYALKNAVQDLVEANILSFEDFEPRPAS